MAGKREEILLPLIRFEYSFDAEIRDADIRVELAKPIPPGRGAAGVMPLMTEIRSRIERVLADIPGLRTEVGLSELRCPGATDLSGWPPELRPASAADSRPGR